MADLRVYVAGASAEVMLVRGYMARLRAAGITITHDWTDDVVALGADASVLTREQRLSIAARDLAAIDAADVFWLLAPTLPTRSTGCWVELGFALRAARRPRVLVSGEGASVCVFSALAERFDSHENGFRRVLREQDGRVRL